MQDGVIHNIQVSGSLVAASVTKFETTANAPSYRLLIYDSSTDQERFLDPRLPQVGLIICLIGSRLTEPVKPITQQQLRINGKRLFLIGVRSETTVVVFAFDLNRLLDDGAVGDLDQESEPISTYTTAPLYVFSYALPESINPGLPTLPILLFNKTSISYASTMLAHITCLPLSPVGRRDTHGSRAEQHKFSTRSGAVAELVCVGSTGCRAVWLERQWDTDEFRLVKGIFPSRSEALGDSEKPRTALLLPSHVALPFEMHTCQSLAFDETSGRVCLGLHTGDIYIMEF
jgi:hypothetical protein